QTDKGLSNQGWKDSSDSIFHRDGRLASAPIALCEVQAYVYAAKKGASVLAARLGESERSAALADQAETLRVKFEEAFWIEEAGTYAIALDGDKRRCEVLASNAGHCLFAGIASPERAARVADLLTGKRFHSG
ncbi:amylo-alpha-1,6-glucosidase, partial [Pseudomonas aeruginosa]|nr:amylo-alpha-1,6-glucosidase [Pseudomonas aeruginosa]